MFAERTQIIMERASGSRGSTEAVWGGDEKTSGSTRMRVHTQIHARTSAGDIYLCHLAFAGCLHIVFEEPPSSPQHPPPSRPPTPRLVHPSVPPAAQTSTQAWPGVTVPTDEGGDERWRERGRRERRRHEGGMQGHTGCAAAW